KRPRPRSSPAPRSRRRRPSSPIPANDAVTCSTPRSARPAPTVRRPAPAAGLAGFAIGRQPDEMESIRLMRAAVDRGITFLDNCWDYNGGASEERMGKALLDGYRDKVFLMTKIDARPRDAAAKQSDESLRRLRTDHVDLMQIHETIRLEDPDRVFAEGGAIEALTAR